VYIDFGSPKVAKEKNSGWAHISCVYVHYHSGGHFQRNGMNIRQGMSVVSKPYVTSRNSIHKRTFENDGLDPNQLGGR